MYGRRLSQEQICCMPNHDAMFMCISCLCRRVLSYCMQLNKLLPIFQAISGVSKCVGAAVLRKVALYKYDEHRTSWNGTTYELMLVRYFCFSLLFDRLLANMEKRRHPSIQSIQSIQFQFIQCIQSIQSTYVPIYLHVYSRTHCTHIHPSIHSGNRQWSRRHGNARFMRRRQSLTKRMGCTPCIKTQCALHLNMPWFSTGPDMCPRWATSQTNDVKFFNSWAAAL